MTMIHSNLLIFFIVACVLTTTGCISQSPYQNASSSSLTNTPVSTVVPTPSFPNAIISPEPVVTQSLVNNGTAPRNLTTHAMTLQRISAVVTPFPYPSSSYRPGQVLVRYHANLTPDQRMAIASQLNQEIGATVIDSIRYGQQLHLPPEVTVEVAIAFYQENKSVEFVQPNIIYSIGDCSKGPC